MGTVHKSQTFLPQLSKEIGRLTLANFLGIFRIPDSLFFVYLCSRMPKTTYAQVWLSLPNRSLLFQATKRCFLPRWEFIFKARRRVSKLMSCRHRLHKLLFGFRSGRSFNNQFGTAYYVNVSRARAQAWLFHLFCKSRAQAQLNLDFFVKFSSPQKP
jgi:hypothetical protein